MLLSRNSVLLILMACSFSLALWQKEDFMRQQIIQNDNQLKQETTCLNINISNFITEQKLYNGQAKGGYLKIVSAANSALAFNFFGKNGASIQQLKNYPTVIVLGGGPGYTSLFNSLRQMGPLSLSKILSMKVIQNKYSWANDANLLFIDQPIGTGASILTSNQYIPGTVSAAADHFYLAYNQLFSPTGCFSSFNMPQSTPFYILGQGFGGKFAAAFGNKFITQMKKGGQITGFKGLIIGNAFNAPFKILSELGNYGFSLGLLDYQQRAKLQKIILRGNFNNERKDMARLKLDFESAVKYLYEQTGVGYYDITKDGFSEDLVQIFFANSSNLVQFGLSAVSRFSTLSSSVYNKFANDFMQPETYSLEMMLNENYPILIYQGQDDAYVNTAGVINWVQQLNYNQAEQFRNQNFQAWKINGITKGSIKSAGKLTFMIINNAGHYVPQDNPESAYQMFKEWIRSNQ